MEHKEPEKLVGSCENPVRREVDSVDDFEHLGHESSPLKEEIKVMEFLQSTKAESPIDAVFGAIDKGVESAAAVQPDVLKRESEIHNMDTNLLEMGDTFPELQEHNQQFLEDHKMLNKDFLEMERGEFEPPKISSVLDSKPELDIFKPPEKPTFAEEKTDSGKEIKESESIQAFLREPSPKPVTLEPEPITPEPKMLTPKSITPEPEIKEEPKAPTPEPKKVEPKIPEIKADIKPAVERKVEAPSAPEVVVCDRPKDKWVEEYDDTVCSLSAPPEIMQAEVMFFKMGLVESLIYWRDPKKSGPVFGGVLAVLLSLAYFSLISVIAYLSLLLLTGTIAFRIYKNIVQAVQKTGDGHPFKELLETDVSLPPEKVKEVSEVCVAHLNAGVSELRRLFLVEDLVDSIKFGVLLWCLTYLGAWFNGMTLIILAWVALFTLPKVYEVNKTQIDANLEIVRTKLAEITTKVKAAIPIGKKPAEEKKEQ